METVVGGQLGVEGGAQKRAAADGDRAVGGQARQHLDAGADADDLGGADEDGVEGSAAEGGDVDGGLEAVDLASVGVALDVDVEAADEGAVAADDTVGERDEAGAGTPEPARRRMGPARS